MQVKIVNTNGFSVPPSVPISREIRRPLKCRDENFWDKFEHKVIFYDIFYFDNEKIILVGPPLWNFIGEIKHMITKNGIKREIYEENLFSIVIETLEKCDDKLNINIFDKDIELNIGKNYSEFFKEKKCIFTMSKDNDLRWIRDWLLFYKKVHGVEAILFIDNNSSKYSLEEIKEVILESNINGIILNWPYKYGPQGGKCNIWDSNFSQVSAMQVARHRFFSKAKSVLNVDIDELLLPNENSKYQSVFDFFTKSGETHLLFECKWVDVIKNISVEMQNKNRYLYYNTLLKNNPCACKWIVNPKELSFKNHWRVHHLQGMENKISKQFEIRHFMAINTNWKVNRKDRKMEFDSEKHYKDYNLLKWLKYCFN